MPIYRLAAASLNTTPLDWQGNRERAAKAIDLARQAGAQLLCLPELCLSGYGCEDRFLAPDTAERAFASLMILAPQSAGLIVAVGLPIYWHGALYNCMAVLADGRVMALIPKQNLANDGLHYEPRWFKAWQAEHRERVRIMGETLPLGDWALRMGDISLGFEICHDAWVPERPCGRLRGRGVNLLLIPSASHFGQGKQAIRRQLTLDATQKHRMAAIYVNLLGNEAGRAIYDGGAMIADSAGLRGEAARFSFKGISLCSADVELKAVAEGEGTLVAGYQPKPLTSPASDTREFLELSEHEEVLKALALGLRDYGRKAKARGYMLSLSGGADSALCALAVKAMNILQEAEEGAEASNFALPVLRCLYQATENSSKITRDAAQVVAKLAGAEFLEWDLQPLLETYRAQTEKALGRKLDWDQDDVTLQNLQARVRSPGVWALANAEGRLLIATNNRSEASVGYTTMDGDSSGGLAPVAGLGKHFIRGLLKAIETQGVAGLGPLPELACVNVQAPTAELRPLAQQQTDEVDLMPYEILDRIEAQAIRDHLKPIEIWEGLKAEFGEHDSKELADFVIRFFKLWSQSQWKRERLAPSFHLDDHNVDPRTWCRFPILNSGFEEELKELKEKAGV